MGTENPDFILRLLEEHRIFQKGFDALLLQAARAEEPHARAEKLAVLSNFCRVFFEEFHHEKEERLLFPVLAADPRVHAGGPECVLHFDFQMRSPPLEIARRACADAGLEAVEPPWPEPLQRLRESHSPLVIPLEDHEGGRILLRAIDELLNRGDPDGAALRLFRVYGDLQERHIRKEDGCLFCMARTLVSPALWKDLELREPKWTARGLHPLAVAYAPAASD